MFVVEEFNDRVVVRLPEEFNFKYHKEFRECYRHRSPTLTYAIDFRAVTRFDSAALGMLLLMRSHCGDEKSSIHLTNCRPRIKKILDTASFGIYFHIE